MCFGGPDTPKPPEEPEEVIFDDSDRRAAETQPEGPRAGSGKENARKRGASALVIPTSTGIAGGSSGGVGAQLPK